MTGQLVMQLENVIDAHSCQENLRLFGSTFNAQVSASFVVWYCIQDLNVQVFEYSDTEQMCYLYDTAEKDCDVVSGPQTPKVDECNIQ